MVQLCWVTALLLTVGTSISSRQFLPIFTRGPRSLRDTFPFNSAEHRHDLDIGNDVESRADRQNSGNEQSIPFSEVASSYAQGKRCIDKVFMEEKTEWETEVTCEHSYNRRCAKSLVTVYNSAQEEECEENYVKKCFIEYSKHAINVTVNICRTPLVKDCDSEGEEICRTEYESECVTRQEVHDVEDDVVECRTEVEEKCEDETSGYTTNTKCSKWPREVCDVSKKSVKKFTPLTQCDKVPVTLCGPAGCGFRPGVEECHEEVQTVVGDNPEETCTLDPQTTCKHVTKLVPALKEVERCFDVPKEICVRQEINPRKVKVPVIKKWCYVVSCPDSCVEAAKRGECPLECQEFEGNSRCCGGCPAACKKAASAGETLASCAKYRGDLQCYVPPPPPPVTEPVVIEEVCEDYPQCEESAAQGICLNECWERFGEDVDCCPTCPNICKQFASEEKTFSNSSLGLDCSKFTDPACYFTCPGQCRQAVERGETRAECAKYDYLDNCYLPPPCSQECLTAASNGQCPQACQQHRGNSECCFECPTSCRDSYVRGETNPSCQRYSYLDQCYLPPPCPQTCIDAAANDQCPRECERFEGKRECCGGCPRECRESFSRGVTLEKCRKYNMKYDSCFYEPCPEKCQAGAAAGRCEAGCEKYSGNLQCCVPKCEVDCAEAALWGECPAKCKGFSGNPDCCAPTCPAKCSNRRRKECSAGGVSECDGIPGCCPEHFDLVFGAGVYLANEK